QQRGDVFEHDARLGVVGDVADPRFDQVRQAGVVRCLLGHSHGLGLPPLLLAAGTPLRGAGPPGLLSRARPGGAGVAAARAGTARRDRLALPLPLGWPGGIGLVGGRATGSNAMTEVVMDRTRVWLRAWLAA